MEWDVTVKTEEGVKVKDEYEYIEDAMTHDKLPVCVGYISISRRITLTTLQTYHSVSVKVENTKMGIEVTTEQPVSSHTLKSSPFISHNY